MRASHTAMATLLITLGAIWMFCSLLMVLALCGAAARPLPRAETAGQLFDAFEEEEVGNSPTLVSQPASLR